METELSRVGDVTDPQMFEAPARDEILPVILLPEERCEGVEALDCFTWNTELPFQPFPGFGFAPHAARRLRTWTRIAASAAGVTPRMREAAPSVDGRAAASRSTISLERPGIAR